MWRCQKCGEEIEDQFDSCWKCAGDDPKALAGLRFPVPKSFLLCGAVLIFLALIVAVVEYGNSGRIPLQKPSIVNNLRHISSAKQQCALDRGITNSSHVFTEQDLTPYMGRGAAGEYVKSISGEQYVINPLGDPPEARLTNEIKYLGQLLPKGSIIRLAPDGDAECIRSDQPTVRFRWDGHELVAKDR